MRFLQEARKANCSANGCSTQAQVYMEFGQDFYNQYLNHHIIAGSGGSFRITNAYVMQNHYAHIAYTEPRYSPYIPTVLRCKLQMHLIM